MANVSYTVSACQDDARRILQERTAQRILDADLLRWCDLAQSEIAAVTRCLRAEATAASVANQAEYSMPTNCLGTWAIIKVRYNSVDLPNIPYDKREEYLSQNYSSTTSATPKLWSPHGNDLVLCPPPASAGQEIRIWYPKLPTAVTATGEAISIPIIYGPAMGVGMAAWGMLVLGRSQEYRTLHEEMLRLAGMMARKDMPDVPAESPVSSG